MKNLGYYITTIAIRILASILLGSICIVAGCLLGIAYPWMDGFDSND